MAAEPQRETVVKTLPHDLEAERGVLADVLNRNESLSRVRDIVQPEMFDSKRNRTIYEAILGLATDESAIDILTVKSWLEDRGKLEPAVGTAYIADLLRDFPPSVNAEYHAGIVADRYQRRTALMELDSLRASIEQGDSRSIQVDLLESVGDRLRERQSEFRWERLSVAEMLAAEPQPIPWIIPGIVARDEVTVISAQPKDGKTMVTMQSVVDAALGHPVMGLIEVPKPIKVLWIDEEMGRKKITRRIQRIVAACDLSADEREALDQRIDFRPQQGLSLAEQKHLDAVNRTIDETEPDLVVGDSLVALQNGEENSATDRRRFYNQIIVPLKARYECGFLFLAHPPLPTREGHQDAQKRPRGSGDILAQVDRSLCMARISDVKTDDQHTVAVSLETYRSREGEDLEPLTITIDGTSKEPLSISAEYANSAQAQEHIGKEIACEQFMLDKLRHAPDREILQPALKKKCGDAGFRHDIYQSACNGMVAKRTIRLGDPRKGHGSGKWIILTEGTE